MNPFTACTLASMVGYFKDLAELFFGFLDLLRCFNLCRLSRSLATGQRCFSDGGMKLFLHKTQNIQASGVPCNVASSIGPNIFV